MCIIRAQINYINICTNFKIGLLSVKNKQIDLIDRIKLTKRLSFIPEETCAKNQVIIILIPFNTEIKERKKFVKSIIYMKSVTIKKLLEIILRLITNVKN
ncbi:hypothetical protein BpHYR1_005498 [Brachionus plicatilis]|uniref:Uncharacterized protein n=1 Tax=Brachionus plicatilis TaxID=10195 RepID=A0A3M7PBM5_BRAPC|nr:hypothetical protein BpHYR1_005498 [Brachionus plicatilis]